MGNMRKKIKEQVIKREENKWKSRKRGMRRGRLKTMTLNMVSFRNN